jgi:hypothetical protein
VGLDFSVGSDPVCIGFSAAAVFIFALFFALPESLLPFFGLPME